MTINYQQIPGENAPTLAGLLMSLEGIFVRIIKTCDWTELNLYGGPDAFNLINGILQVPFRELLGA